MIRKHLVLAAGILLVTTATAVALSKSASAPQPQSDSELVPGAVTTATVVPDTDEGIDAKLSDAFSMDIHSSVATTTITHDQAIGLARQANPTYASSAKSITARHVVYTNRDMVSSGSDQLVKMGVTERPQNLDAWMVVFHGVTLRMHGPLAQNEAAGGEDAFVMMISSNTGHVIESAGFGPVR